MFPARGFARRKVAVFGLARSGLAVIAALKAGGAEVVAWDDSEVARAAAAGDGLALGDLDRLDFAGFDSLVVSPGVPFTHPEPHWTIRKARAAGIEVIGDTEVFVREVAGSGARVVAVTGTNGKSTTTALIGHVAGSAGLSVEVGGNIGKAVFLLGAPRPDHVYVLELSSFQIDLTPSLRPDVGVLLNLTPDHLDRHGTMEEYASVKAKMFTRQRARDTAVIGVDDGWSAAIAEEAAKTTNVVRISVERELNNGVYAADGTLHDRSTDGAGSRIDLRTVRSLKGKHNWQNACAAYAVARALRLSPAAIEAGMRSFPGLAHRMEEVGSMGDVVFVNDSKATNADAAAKALSSYDTIYWIAGGIPKSGGIASLKGFFPRIAKSYLIGQAADEFAHTIGGATRVELCGTLDRAVTAAARDASGEARPDAVVLLSPACASFDHYPNFEVRGEAFRKLVAALPGIAMRGEGG